MIVCIEGVVEHGKHLGRTIGFPTANVRPDDPDILPGDGVYAAALWLEGDEKAYPCMLNQGSHPTAPEGDPTIEVHILNFDGDIYGCRVRVEYLCFLRHEESFENLDALKAQLTTDREFTGKWILKNADNGCWHEESLNPYR